MAGNPEKFWRIAPHVHTDRSDGVSIKKIMARARETGIHAVGLMDHDVDPPDPINTGLPNVLLGKETSSVQGHILVYAKEEQDRDFLKAITMGRSAYETVRTAHREGLLVVIPHMGWSISPGSVAPQTLSDLYQKGEYIDGLEVKNPVFTRRHKQQASQLAETYNISKLGASDDHKGEPAERYITLVPKKTRDPRKDFFSALKEKTTIPADSGIILSEAEVGQSIAFFLKCFAKGIWHGKHKLPYLHVFASTFLSLRFEELKRFMESIYGK